MKTRWMITSAAAVALALAGCESNNMWGGQNKDKDDDDNGKEQAVTMDQLPANVKATLAREAGNGKVEEIDRMTMHGKTVYEADVTMDGKKWEIMVREDGQLLKKQLDEETDAEDEKHEKEDNGKR